MAMNVISKFVICDCNVRHNFAYNAAADDNDNNIITVLIINAFLSNIEQT